MQLQPRLSEVLILFERQSQSDMAEQFISGNTTVWSRRASPRRLTPDHLTHPHTYAKNRLPSGHTASRHTLAGSSEWPVHLLPSFSSNLDHHISAQLPRGAVPIRRQHDFVGVSMTDWTIRMDLAVRDWVLDVDALM
jgi:hypothetical protein